MQTIPVLEVVSNEEQVLAICLHMKRSVKFKLAKLEEHKPRAVGTSTI